MKYSSVSERVTQRGVHSGRGVGRGRVRGRGVLV